MDTTPEYFNQNHSVSDLLKGKVAVDLPTRLEEVDLRFLRMIRFSDTWDGDGDPSDGTLYLAVLYGNQIAWERDKFYLNCERQMSGEKGNKLYRDLYFASQLYLKILDVASALFHKELIRRGADRFYMGPEELALLQHHPQFKEMVRDFGLELHPTKKNHHFRVTVSKFYVRSTA